MAEIKTTDVIDSAGLTTELQKIIDKFNELLGTMKTTSGEFQKASGSTKKLTEAEKQLSEEKKKQIANEKALIAENKKLEADRLKQVAVLEKQAQKQKELIEAANKEVKTLGDLNAKLAARRKLIQGLEMGTDAYNEMATSISELAKQQDIANSGLGIFNQRVGNYQKAVDTVNMSLGEMKKELSGLRNMSFGNLTPAEIVVVKDRMAELNGKIKDFQKELKAASVSTIPSLLNGLQGIVAATQSVTGVMAIAGVNTEKLDKAMVQLIGISQALATIEDLHAKKTLSVAWATAKDTAAKIANAVAAKGQAMATTGATAATRALGKAMMTNPYLMIAAAAAAAAAGIILLIKYMKGQTTEMQLQSKMYKEMANMKGGYLANLEIEKQSMNSLFEEIKKTNAGTEERKILVDELNRNYKDYLPNLDLEKATIQELVIAQKASNVELQNKIAIQAQDKAMSEIITKMTDLKIKEMEATQKLTRAEQDRDEAMRSGSDAQMSYIQIYNKAKADLDAITYSLQAQEQQLKNVQEYFRGQITATQQSTEATKAETKAKETNTNTTNAANDAKKSYTQALAKANEEAILSIALGENELLVKAKQLQAIYDATKAYYELNGYTQAEIDELKKLKQEIAAVNSELDLIKWDLDISKSIKEDMQNAVKDLTTIKPIDTEITFKAEIPEEEVEDLSKKFTLTFSEKLKKSFKMNKSISDALKSFFGDESVKTTADEVVNMMGTIADAADTLFDRQISKLDEVAEKNAKYYDDLMKNYEQDSAEYAQLQAQKEQKDREYQIKLVALERKKAAFDKAKALIDIAIATAVNIVKLLEQPYLAAAVGVAGAIQAGVVASQPLPQYYVGLDSAKTDHMASVAERGAELVNYPDGTSELFTKPTVTFIPKYTSINTADETVKRLSAMQSTANFTEFNDNSRKQLGYLGQIARNTGKQSAKDLYYIQHYVK